MSMAKEVTFASQSSDVAMQFFNLLYEERHPRSKTTKSPHTTHKQLAKSRVEIGTTAQEEGEEPVETAAAQTQQQTTAMIIAQRLKVMGDDIEQRYSQELTQELKKKFEEQFKLKSVFHMAYNNFSMVCRQFLASVQDKLRSGWEQVYLIYYGHYVVGEEMRRQAIQAGQADDGTLDGIAMTSQFVGEFMQEIQLDEWVNFHGGLESASPDVPEAGEAMVNVSVPPEGSSVDKN